MWAHGEGQKEQSGGRQRGDVAQRKSLGKMGCELNLKVKEEVARQDRRNNMCKGVEKAFWMFRRPPKQHSITGGYVWCAMG